MDVLKFVGKVAMRPFDLDYQFSEAVAACDFKKIVQVGEQVISKEVRWVHKFICPSGFELMKIDEEYCKLVLKKSKGKYASSKTHEYLTKMVFDCGSTEMRTFYGACYISELILNFRRVVVGLMRGDRQRGLAWTRTAVLEDLAMSSGKISVNRLLAEHVSHCLHPSTCTHDAVTLFFKK